MTTKNTQILTRKLKQTVLDNPEKVQLLDEETQEQLKHIIKAKTPSSQGSTGKNLSQSSHISTKSRKSGSTLNLREQLESTVWVQCDKVDCFKWRRVTTAELEGVTEDSKWFCSMNKSPEFASCDVPEEDTEWYDRAAKRVGLRYVKTAIAEGSLVWAKMIGYCKWPGILTKDPRNHLHCLLNVDGEPRWYHVEFLGGSHTHSWVRATSVKLFTLQSSPPVNREQSRKLGFQGQRKLKKLCLKSGSKQLQKTIYKNGVSVKEACLEASRLFSLSNCERLSRCNFINICSAGVIEVAAGEAVGEWKAKDCNWSKFSVSQKIKGEKTFNKDIMKPVESCVLPTTPELSPSLGETPNLASLEMKFSDSLINHSKEEKLVLDVQMYQRNERAFEHDVLRFMKRNGMNFRGIPRWQNTSISLFQLFLAVHERGGYEQVCSVRGGWVQVYKELTECHNSGEVAKKYYRRNLYPYELYIKGKSFRSALPAKYQRRKKRKETPDVSSSDILPSTDTDWGQYNNSQDLKKKQWIELSSYLDRDSLLSSETSVDLMEMLGDLETNGNFCSLEDDINISKAKLGIDITFFDQSPQKPHKDCRNIKEANTAAEFGYTVQSNMESHIQEVPDVSVHSSSSPDHLLHEMQALQDGIDLVAGEMDIL